MAIGQRINNKKFIVNKGRNKVKNSKCDLCGKYIQKYNAEHCTACSNIVTKERHNDMKRIEREKKLRQLYWKDEADKGISKGNK